MLKLGSTDINKLYLGATEVKKVYLGSTLVYDKTAVFVGAIADLNVTAFDDTTITLDWTTPSADNPIDYYEVYLDGVFYENTTDASEGWVITGLTASTSYDITLKTVDDVGNKSAFSNEVTQSTSSGVVYDTDFQSFLDYAILQGYYIPSSTILDEANAQVIRDKANGYWGANVTYRIWAWNDTGCDDLSLICLKTLVEATVHGGMTYTVNGWKGNGTDGYIDLNFTPTTHGAGIYTATNASRSYVMYDSGVVEYARISGHTSDLLDLAFVADSIASQRINLVTSSVTPRYNVSGTGFQCVNRTSNTVTNFIKQSTQTSHTNNKGTASLSAQSYLVFGGLSSYYGDVGLSSFALGRALTYAETQDYRTDFNTYLVAIGLSAIA